MLNVISRAGNKRLGGLKRLLFQTVKLFLFPLFVIFQWHGWLSVWNPPKNDFNYERQYRQQA